MSRGLLRIGKIRHFTVFSLHPSLHHLATQNLSHSRSRQDCKVALKYVILWCNCTPVSTLSRTLVFLKMADSGDSNYLFHGCRCLEGDEPNRPHFHCPCVVSNGRVVSLMIGWRHDEKNRTLNADQKNLDVQKAVHEIASHVDREGYYEEVTTASFLAPYSQLVANRRGNLCTSNHYFSAMTAC